MPVTVILAALCMLASAWDATFFCLAIADGNATQAQSESLLRWLPHECRSPVAAAVVSLDTAISDIAPGVEELLKGVSSAGSHRSSASKTLSNPAPGNLPTALGEEWGELMASLRMAQQPLLDNMLLYMRRERSLLSSRHNVETQVWGNHSLSLQSLWRAIIANASAMEGLAGEMLGGELHRDRGITLQHWTAGTDTGSGEQTILVIDDSAIEADLGATTETRSMRHNQQPNLLSTKCSSSVTFSTTVQLLTNYLSNAFKYGCISGTEMRCTVRFTSYDSQWLTAAGCDSSRHHSGITRRAARDNPSGTSVVPVQSTLGAPGGATDSNDSVRSDATLHSCSTPAKQYRCFASQVAAAWRVSKALEQQAVVNQGEQVGPDGLSRAHATSPSACSGALLVTVIDKGVGLSALDASTLFRPFARLRSGGNVHGNGLGLWLMKGLVNSQGGALGVHSEGLGGGCAFAAALPVLARASTESSSQGSHASATDAAVPNSKLPVTHTAASADSAAVHVAGVKIMKTASAAGSNGANSYTSVSVPPKLQQDDRQILVGPGATADRGDEPRSVSASTAPLGSHAVHHSVGSSLASESPDAHTTVPHLVEAASGFSVRSSAGMSGHAFSSQPHALPQSNATTAQTTSEQPDRPPRMRVLVVDESPTNRIMMARGIARRGHQVVQANDGQEALAAYLAVMEANTPFQMVVTDMTMPRMNGDELATAVHSAWAEHCIAGGTGMNAAVGPIVIGVTGNAMEGDVDAFLVAGAHAVLLKPTSVTKVLAAAAEALGAQSDMHPVQASP